MTIYRGGYIIWSRGKGNTSKKGSEHIVTGSEKQIKWYEEILKEAYDYLDARYNHKIADEVEKQAVSLVRAEMEKAMKNITEASQLIDNRRLFSAEQLNRNICMVREYLKNQK